MTTRTNSSISFHLFFASWIALTAGLSLAAVACGSDSGDEKEGTAGAGSETGVGGSSNSNGGNSNNSNGGSSNNSNGGSSNGGKGGGTSCVSCNDGCPNIVCECKDGEIINTTSCNNGCCEPKEVACPDSCSDHGGWGSSGGGNGGSSGGGTGGSSGGSNGQDIGGECQGDGDCLSNICLFKGGADFGYCSKMCESFADCPSFWDCGPVGNGSGNYCIQGD